VSCVLDLRSRPVRLVRRLTMSLPSARQMFGIMEVETTF
jgi:hypothetical protein